MTEKGKKITKIVVISVVGVLLAMVAIHLSLHWSSVMEFAKKMHGG